MVDDSSHPPAEEKLWLDGPAGRLEALLRPASGGGRPARVALLCHPHPLFGGTMMNKTLYRLAKRLPAELGVPTLRFNFRGAGASEGAHDGGDGERGDVRAALDWLQERFGAAPVLLVGYSFGAVVGLRVGLADDRVDQLVGLGLPLQRDWDLSWLDEGVAKPLLLVHGEKDEFGPAPRMRPFADGLAALGPATVRLHVVPGADHLFHGVEDQAVQAVLDHTRALVEGA